MSALDTVNYNASLPNVISSMSDSEDEDIDSLRKEIKVLGMQDRRQRQAYVEENKISIHSPGSSRDQLGVAVRTDSKSIGTNDKKKEKTKWKKLKSEISRSSKSLTQRIKPGGSKKSRNVVQDICILPPSALNGECFAEDGERPGLSRTSSDDSLVFASRTAAGSQMMSRMTPRDDVAKDSTLVIYDAEYDGTL